MTGVCQEECFYFFLQIISKLLHKIMLLSASKLLSSLQPKVLQGETEQTEPVISKDRVEKNASLGRAWGRHPMLCFPLNGGTAALANYASYGDSDSAENHNSWNYIPHAHLNCYSDANKVWRNHPSILKCLRVILI